MLSEDELHHLALRELTGLVEGVAQRRALTLVAERIERDDLVPRPATELAGQPSGHVVMVAMLRAIEHAGRHGHAGTFAGAHLVALRAAQDLGVWGADQRIAMKRSRSQLEANPTELHQEPPEITEVLGPSMPAPKRRR